MAQLMPLPLIVSCFSKIQIGFTFLVPAPLGSPGERAVKRMCVCVRVCVWYGNGKTDIWNSRQNFLNAFNNIKVQWRHANRYLRKSSAAQCVNVYVRFSVLNNSWRDILHLPAVGRFLRNSTVVVLSHREPLSYSEQFTFSPYKKPAARFTKYLTIYHQISKMW